MLTQTTASLANDKLGDFWRRGRYVHMPFSEMNSIKEKNVDDFEKQL